MPPPTHELVALDVNGDAVLTELVSAGAPARSARVLIAVLPGNPGAALFYAPFVAALAAHAARAGAGASVRVVCCGHASHTALTASPRALSLSGQVAHKLAFLEAELAAAPAGLRVVLVGHSVGAYMALQAAGSPRLPRGCVAAAALLTPTLLDIGRSPRGRALAPLFTGLGVFGLGALAFLVRALVPRALLLRAAAAVVGARAAAAAAGLVHAHVAAATLVLARHEMAEIGGDLGEAALAAARALGPRVFAFFAEGDHWNSEGDVARVSALLPRARVEVDSEHSHSFVLNAGSVEAIAARTWAHADEALGGGLGAAVTPAFGGNGGGGGGGGGGNGNGGGRRARRGSR